MMITEARLTGYEPKLSVNDLGELREAFIEGFKATLHNQDKLDPYRAAVRQSINFDDLTIIFTTDLFGTDPQYSPTDLNKRRYVAWINQGMNTLTKLVVGWCNSTDEALGLLIKELTRSLFMNYDYFDTLTDPLHIRKHENRIEFNRPFGKSEFFNYLLVIPRVKRSNSDLADDAKVNIADIDTSSFDEEDNKVLQSLVDYYRNIKVAKLVDVYGNVVTRNPLLHYVNYIFDYDNGLRVVVCYCNLKVNEYHLEEVTDRFI